MTLRGSVHDEPNYTLEDRTAAESYPRATLTHYDPVSGRELSYEFSIDPSLAEPGVPEWVTHYHLFPEEVQGAIAGLYEKHVTSIENTLRERS